MNNNNVKKISMNIPEWQIKFLDEYAEFSGMTRTSVICMLITDFAKDNIDLLNLLRDITYNTIVTNDMKNSEQEFNNKLTNPTNSQSIGSNEFNNEKTKIERNEINSTDKQQLYSKKSYIEVKRMNDLKNQ